MPQKSLLAAFFALLIVAVTFLVYSQTLGFDFVNWDDDVYLLENDRAQSLTIPNIAWFFSHPYYHSYIPLTMVSHMVDYALWQFNPSGHHLTNSVLHAFNAALLFMVSIQVLTLAGQGPALRSLREVLTLNVDKTILVGAAAGAAFFALHPLRAESVAWISDRKDLLCTFFVLSSGFCYVNAAAQGAHKRWYAAALIFFLLACLSKSIAVTLPLVFLLMDVLLLKRLEDGKTVRELIVEKIPFAVITIVIAVVAAAVAPDSLSTDMFDALTVVQIFLLPLYNIAVYVAKTIVPLHLSPLYPLPGETEMVVAAAAFLAVSFMFVRWAKRGAIGPLLAWLCYCITIVPSSGLSLTVMQTTADRYAYFPSLALFLLVGGGIGTLMTHFQSHTTRAAIVSVLLLGAGFFGFLTLRQQRIWANSETLWGRVISLHPTLPLPHNNMGLALQARGAFGEAEAAYLRAIELKPDYVEAHVNLANIMYAKGNWDEAERLLQRAAEIDPRRAEVFNNLGVVANTRGDTREALHWFRKSIEVNPAYAQGHFNLGVLLAKMGNADAAREALQAAARLGHRAAQENLRREGFSW